VAGPDGGELASAFRDMEAQLKRILNRSLLARRQELEGLKKRLRNPSDRLRESAQHLDHLEIRLIRAMNTGLAQRRQRLRQLATQVDAIRPDRLLEQKKTAVSQLAARLRRAVHGDLQRRSDQLARLAATLNAVSPLATLERGYAIARDGDRNIVRVVNQVAKGQPLEVLVADGALDCTVESSRQWGKDSPFRLFPADSDDKDSEPS
jgi:exodeoxyribonuclease VII large subunit